MVRFILSLTLLITLVFVLILGVLFWMDWVQANPLGVLDSGSAVDSVLVPFQVKQKVLGQEFTVTVESMKTNVEIPKERFALPDDVKALAAAQTK